LARRVFPARAGMIRMPRSLALRSSSVPRASGDDPSFQIT